MEEEQPKPLEPQTAEDFVSDYANNVAFEQTVWDLKMIFGEFSGRLSAVEWHTSITVPWAMAKLMSYYLQINVAARELRAGKIEVPRSMIPPGPPPPPPSDPLEKAIFEMIQEHRKKLLETL